LNTTQKKKKGGGEMKKKIVWLVVSCLMMVALVLASCGPAVTEEEEEVTEGKEMVRDSLGRLVEKPRYGGTFVWPRDQEDTRVDVLAGPGPIQSAEAELYVTDRFTALDWTKGPSGTGESSLYHTATFYYLQVPALAESWEIVEPDTIILHIRQGVHWQNKPPANGREMTTDDVVYNIKLYYSIPGTYFTSSYPYLADMKNVDNSVQKTGEWTVEVKIQPGRLAAAWETLSQNVHMIPPEARELYGDLNDWENLQGTGPFMITDYQTGSYIAYERNPDYWMKDPFFPENQLPYVDGLKLMFLLDESVRQAALRTGKIDILDDLEKEDAESLMSTNPELKWTKNLMQLPYNLYMRNDKPPFDDINVRRAMSMAINRQEILDEYYEGDGVLLAYPGYPYKEFAAYQPTLEELPEDVRELYEYHPDKAAQILDEAGYPGPDRFTANVVCYEDEQIDLASIIADYWAKVGVTLEISKVEFGVWQSMKNGFTVPQGAIEHTYTASEMFKHMTTRTTHQNNFIMQKEELPDTIYQENFKLFFDDKARATYLKSMAPVILSRVYIFPLPCPYTYLMWQPWVKGYNGEMVISTNTAWTFQAYIWLDQDLMEEMIGTR
jgi:peptide/nickel transport system substrate-binding protein